MGIKGNKNRFPAVTGSGHVQTEVNLMNKEILTHHSRQVKHPRSAHGEGYDE